MCTNVYPSIYLLLLALKAIAQCLVCVCVCVCVYLSVCFIMVCFNSVSGVECECAFLCLSSFQQQAVIDCVFSLGGGKFYFQQARSLLIINLQGKCIFHWVQPQSFFPSLKPPALLDKWPYWAKHEIGFLLSAQIAQCYSIFYCSTRGEESVCVYCELHESYFRKLIM